MPLDAVITVADYRPVYISGAVRSPGEYRYRPGLGVVQLLAQAGGSLLDQTAQNVDARDILNREGAMSLLEREGERLSARRAMLRAAIAGQAELAPQDALSSILMDTENDVLQLRRQQRARELTALNDQISLLANEVTALTARAEAVDRLREIAQEEYESALALVQRGLAASGRIGEAERAIAQAEAQQLDISTAILRARQGITIAEAEKLALRDREMIEDTRQLQVVDERLDQIMANLETQQRIALAETGMFVQQRLGDEDTALPKPIVTIRRTTAQGIETLSGLDVILAPGDVVEVTMPRLANRWNQALPAAMTQ
ncbi:MAG: SLBB domain-containing protein, partial [Loktanella sp.]|nr:SLBB domain-containing protein [Loktanella sp.]